MVWWLLVGSSALAQEQTPIVPRLNAQLYRPAVDARSTLWAESAGTIVDGVVPMPRVALHYVNRPLVFLPEEGGAPTVLVSDALQLDAVFSTGVDRFRFAIDIPVYLYSAGQLTDDGPGIGDIAIDGRATILDPEDAPLGLAVSGRIGFPSATVASPLGDSGPSGELVAVAEVRATDALVVVGNLGTRVNPTAELLNVQVDDQLVWRAGAGYALAAEGDAGLSLDLAGRATYATPLSNPAGLPVEALVGGWARVSEDWVLRLGVGRGLTPGIGSPQARIVTMITLDPPVERDTDLDGLLDGDDLCPAEAEDRDGFLDDDGCPEIDNDEDGLLDAADACPSDPEDPDGFEDVDGCPDPSSQVELRVLGPDGAPLPGATLTLTGPQEVEAGGDALVDLHPGRFTARASLPGYVAAEVVFDAPADDVVIVTLEPEAALGTLGVMVLGPAGDPVPGATWAVDGRLLPELVDGRGSHSIGEGTHELVIEAEGYAASRQEVTVTADEVTDLVVVLRPPRVRVTRDRINITERIYFETGKATIKSESHDLLDEIATTLLDHPEIRKVRIEGHTDSRGSARYNLELSKDRSSAVREYLVEAGVVGARLVSEGYGETRPVDDREVPEAWDQNRRVDFVIEVIDGEGDAAEPEGAEGG